MYFHRCLLQKIVEWWDKAEDWGIVEGFKEDAGRMYCCLPGIVQHIGEEGVHSKKGDPYDKAV